MGRINRRRDRYLKRVVEVLLRPFFRRPKMDMDAIRASQPRRILIVRQHNQMGDMLCATPALRAIRRAFPGCETMLITAPINHQVVAGNPDIDRVLVFDKVSLRTSLSRIRMFWRELRGFSADLAVVLNTVSFSGTSAWLAMLSGARILIGGDSTPFGWSFSRWLYNLEMPAVYETGIHAVDHGLVPLAAVGIASAGRDTTFVPPAEAERRAASFLAGLGSGPLFAAHPGAGKVGNQWPGERFAAAVTWARSKGFTVFLIEGPVDGPATAATLRHVDEGADGPIPVLRDVSLAVVAAVLARADLALVNDTGVMHVAGAMGTPTVALFGPTPASEWSPPSNQLVSLQSPDGTMAGLTVHDVLSALDQRRRQSSTSSGRSSAD